MNGKQYIGRRMGRYESYGLTRPVDGIALVVDEEHEYRAGDMTDCPYGSQAMADALLAQIGGKSYVGYTAENAVMDPAAELGDGVTVKGTYSLLASRQMTLGSGHLGQISAPAEGEMDHEYAVEEPTMRQIERKLAQARSYIEKTTEEIKIGVEGVQGDVAELKVSVGSISSTVSDYEGRISTVEQTATTLSSTVSGLEGDVSELEQTAGNIKLSVSGSLGGSASITLSGGGGGGGTLNLSKVRDAWANDKSNVTVSGGTITFNGGGITFNTGTFEVNADNLTIDKNGNVTCNFGNMNHVNVDYAYFKRGPYSDPEGFCAGFAGHIVLDTDTNPETSVAIYGDADVGVHEIREIAMLYASANYKRNGVPCAMVGYECPVRLNGTYVSTTMNPVADSDRRAKKDIAAMPEKYMAMLDGMTPRLFRYTWEAEDAPLHSGYVAQEMQAAMEAAGLAPDQVGALSMGGEEQLMGISYSELIPMLHMKIRALEGRIERLEGAA